MRPKPVHPDDPAYRTVNRTVTARDGTHLAWHTHLPPGGSEADLRGRRTVILTNGIGTTEVFWRDLVAALSPRYRVVHWNYRGHGYSESSSKRDYRIETHADDLVRVTEAALARPESDGRAPVQVGFSMGVVVALEAYRARPDLSSALVLLAGGADAPWRNTGPFRVPGVSLAVRGALAALTPLVPLAGPGVRFVTSLPMVYPLATMTGIVRRRARRLDIEHLLNEMSAMDLRAFWGSLRGLMAARAQDVLPEVKVPTLILSAAHDVFVPARETELLAKRIPGSRFVLVRDAGHAALTEAGGELSSELCAFLEDPAVR